jgi:hypothetical protein
LDVVEPHHALDVVNQLSMGHGKSPSLVGKATINGLYLVGGEKKPS